MVPVFGAFWVWMRVRDALVGPVVLETEALSGLRFECRLPDLIQSYLYLFGTWEPDVDAFISRRLEPGDVFVDVGANIGFHTLRAQQALGGVGRVVAIEGSPSVADQLAATLDLNGLDTEVRIVRTAVADSAGTLTMFRGPNRNLGLSTSVAERGFSVESEVRCDRLANLLLAEELEQLRIVKIDVEGGEPAVVAGMVGLLADLSDRVEFVLELSPKWWSDPHLTPAEVLEPFRVAGYHLYEIDNDLWPWRYLWPRSIRPPRRAERDLLARPKRIDAVLSRVDADEL